MFEKVIELDAPQTEDGWRVVECPTCGAQLVAKDASWLAHRSTNAHMLMTNSPLYVAEELE